MPGARARSSSAARPPDRARGRLDHRGWIARFGEIRRWHPGYSSLGGRRRDRRGRECPAGPATLSHVLLPGMGSFLLLASIIWLRLFVVPQLAAGVCRPRDGSAAGGGGRHLVCHQRRPAEHHRGRHLRLRSPDAAGSAEAHPALPGRAPFGPGFWAFSFPAAAAVTLRPALTSGRGARARRPRPSATPSSGSSPAGFALLAARTITGLINGTFVLPRPGPRPRRSSVLRKQLVPLRVHSPQLPGDRGDLLREPVLQRCGPAAPIGRRCPARRGSAGRPLGR